MANNAAIPEHQMTLLLTRPAASSVRFVMRLDPAVASQATLVISPVLKIVGLDMQIGLADYAGVILSSVNGVTHSPAGRGMLAYCVGAQTAAAAKGQGWHVAQVALDADDLVAAMKEHAYKGPLLHLSGRYQRGDIAVRLTELGIKTDRLVIYDQRPVALTDAAQAALCGEGTVVLPLFSPRSAAQFVVQAQETRFVKAVAMSAAVARELADYAFADVQVLSTPRGDEMVRAVELLLSQDRLP